MAQKQFIQAMKDIMSLGGKSVTVSKDDFAQLIKYAEPFDNTRLRETVIGQSGYGLDGCKLCHSEWMRRPNTEKQSHKSTCPAYPMDNNY